MYLFYSLLLTIGFVVLLPRFAIDALRNRKYVTGLGQRLGNIPDFSRAHRRLIWLHCVSVGETEAARPFVRALRKNFPSYQLVISTTTVTGQQVARRAFADDAAGIFYFPIDWAWVIRRVLNKLQPQAVLIMETELWPNLMRECQRRSIATAIINGRISEKSFGRYRMIRSFMTRILRNLSVAAMQSEPDALRIRELGMSPERILVTGNLKFDSAANQSDSVLAAALRERFRLTKDQQLIVAASTHAPEEEIVLAAFQRIKQSFRGEPIRLLVAPRHPERFAEVAGLIEATGLTWARRSTPLNNADASCDVILLDSIGELRAVFSLAEIAFIGGSIAAHGGHNVLEPAVNGVCVITGAHTGNFAAITKALLAEDALVQLRDVSSAEAVKELATVASELLQDESRRRQIGQRAMSVCERNRGATERSLAIVADLLQSRVPAGETLPLPAVSVAAK
jgi:3-deoxy-D-manno-octulosonic-acid transferase